MSARTVVAYSVVSLVAAGAAFAEALDFERFDVGAVPAGWTVAMTSDGGPPRWEIVLDSTSPAGEKVLAQVSADRTSGRFPLAIRDGVETADGSISVHFKPISGRVDQAAGIVWRYRDPRNYYIVRANALEDNVVLYKVENGLRSPLPPVGRGDDYGVEHPVPANRWSALAVTFEGTRFTVSFDGTPLFEVDDSTFMSAGKLGLWTKADSVTYFDGFEVSER